MENNFEKNMTNTLRIEFDNPEAALLHFKSWLCGSGEQSYWTWMECREDEEDGPITAKRFNYHKDGPLIEAECGRLDTDDE